MGMLQIFFFMLLELRQVHYQRSNEDDCSAFKHHKNSLLISISLSNFLKKIITILYFMYFNNLRPFEFASVKAITITVHFDINFQPRKSTV